MGGKVPAIQTRIVCMEITDKDMDLFRKVSMWLNISAPDPSGIAPDFKEWYENLKAEVKK